MNVRAHWWLLQLVVIGALSLFGCGQKKTASQATNQETPSSTQQETPQAQPPGEAAEHGESGEAITPAGTVAAIWAQITEEQQELSTAIQNGQLKDVHHHAFGIRDLVVALSDKANTSTPQAAPKLNALVEEVKSSADKLDEMGDAGNLSGTQAEFAKLNTTLDAIKAVVNPM